MMDIIELSNKSISDVVSIIKKRSNTLNVRKSVEEIIENVGGLETYNEILKNYYLTIDYIVKLYEGGIFKNAR